VADLAGAAGGASADGQTDTVTRTAAGGDDVVAVAGNGAGGVDVTGLPGAVSVDHPDPADGLVVNLLGGDDVLNASTVPAGRVALSIDAGLGDDVVIGSPGDDLVDGGDGDDLALQGAGNDTFRWEPGDDNDTIEGQAGTADRLVFVGSGVAENFDVSANGGRVLFFRNVANVLMDMNDVEAIDLSTLGGADTVTVNDLSGTDLTQARVDLAGAGGTAGDGQVDNVILNGTNGSDQVTVAGTAATGVTATGLATSLSIQHAEAAVGDRLRVNTLGNGDGVGAANLAADAIRLTLDGGAGVDVLTGGAGDDQIIGGPGADFLFGGTGVDTFDNDLSDFQQQD
jgi:Ca2+-binding RTX toxin-like protein